MKIEACVSVIGNNPVVTIEHMGKILTFSISSSSYRRDKFTAGFDVFSQINAFWNDQSPVVQDKIFNIYSRIFDAFDSIHTPTSLQEHLRQLVKELLSYHDLEYVLDWIAFRAHDIKTPYSIPDEFVADISSNKSMGKTYIVRDYKRLVAFSLVLRCMIPIWGEYIYSIKKTAGSNIKEMIAFQLVDHVFTPDVPVIKKLMEYIENNLNIDNSTRLVGIFKGISSADYTRWLLSLVSIHCLSVGDIRGTNPDVHLLTYIYNYITHRLVSKDDIGDSRVKPKDLDRETIDDNQSKASALERYKVKANIAICDIIESEFILSQSWRVASYLAPGIEEEQVTSALSRIKEHEGRATIPQVTLLKWVLSPIVSPRIIMYLPEVLIKELMAVTEAVLWKRGHPYLSILASCYPATSEREMVVSPVDSKKRIPPHLIDRLNELYPYQRNNIGRTTTGKDASRDTNLAMESIDIITNNFMSYAWRAIAPIEHIEMFLGSKSRSFPIKPDIKTDLANLVIDIQERKSLIRKE